ncbi:TlpA disulfide reductase family protein [Sphingobacterium griseoflavum]|uniref:Thiol:disulfide interchange protein n=1 Tax=Sphingobacterium griseoflavum TaxID=1474952 RepID=A0ABQ3HXJ4_9SPHI|nr:TlpA disulfide reductase family protein [Sphingobacterium griseoflavum]GHE44687.1 thiol:disulfide interchange protein [Sphingobacterium griseoflavum]
MDAIKQVIAVLLLLHASCGMAQDRFEIQGRIPSLETGGKIVLSYVNSHGKNALDSAIVKKGRFSFHGTTSFAHKAQLSYRPINSSVAKKEATAPDYQQFYLEKGTYRVKGKDSLSNATIKGTAAQEDFNAYNLLTKDLLAQFKDITARFSKVYYAKVKDTLAIQAIQAEARPVHARIEAVLDSFIFSHPDSYVALDLILENKTAVIDPATFGKYYDPLSARVLASFNGQRLTEKYEKAKQIAIGKVVDFEQPDIDGNIFRLSSLRGKYVLVDFWASWCMPCRAENPNLLKAYEAFKDKNFEIVGVSLDEGRAAWLTAVEQDGMPWKQVSELKDFKTGLAVKYGITAIPQNFLINPEGVIVAKDLRGENVEKIIASFIK